jgi:hypothetical protein
VNYTVEITLNYNEIGVGTGSLTRTVNADITNVKPESSNVGGGRQEDSISGNIILNNRTGDYDAFAVYLNDSAYYVHEEDYTYNLWINGDQYNTNKIRLTNNNVDGKRLTFKLFDNAVNQYTNIFANWDVEYNIVQADPSSDKTQIEYIDFRELYDNGATVLPSVNITSQQSYETYIQTLIDSYDTETPYSVTLGFVAGTTYIPSVSTKEFRAIGYKNGTNNEPPAGVDWVYDADVSSQPRFIKAPKVRSIDYGTYTGLGNISTTINIEQEADMIFTGTGTNYAQRLDSVIQYLVGQADSSIGFLDSPWDGFDNLVGESFTPSTGVGTSDKFMKIPYLMPVGNLMPTLAGNIKNNEAEKGMMSLGVLMSFLEDMGFFWYITYSAVFGAYQFKLEHITTRTFGSSNPSISEYAYKSRDINIIEDIYNKLTNNTVSSDYHFTEPEFIFRVGEKSKTFGQSRISTDLDYVVDAKESVFDITSGDQWALMCVTYDQTDTYEIRRITSVLNSIVTNNYELSFYYLSRNIIEVPGKLDKDGNSYADSRLQKKKTVTLDIKLDNPQTDYTFYDSVSYFGEDAEIQNLRKNKITDSEGQIIIKFK